MARHISAAERQDMIAEAAYFIALARGLAGGSPVADWLTAEREISRWLASQQAEARKVQAT